MGSESELNISQYKAIQLTVLEQRLATSPGKRILFLNQSQSSLRR